MSYEKNSHCSFCGVKFPETVVRHALCASCGSETWISPSPVSVMVLPVQDDDGRFGVLLVRRGIEPMRGGLALPGGYVEHGETLEAAAIRELGEETGVVLPDDWPVRLTHSRPARGVMTVAFCVARPVPRAALPRPFIPNAETQEIALVHAPIELCFTTHTEALALHFERLARLPAP